MCGMLIWGLGRRTMGEVCVAFESVDDVVVCRGMRTMSILGWTLSSQSGSGTVPLVLGRVSRL
jgi:hypothetical protein